MYPKLIWMKQNVSFACSNYRSNWQLIDNFCLHLSEPNCIETRRKRIVNRILTIERRCTVISVSRFTSNLYQYKMISIQYIIWYFLQEKKKFVWDLLMWIVPPHKNMFLFPIFNKTRIVLYNAITQNNCLVKGSHKYNVYLIGKYKAHLNWPNKHWFWFNATICSAQMTPTKVMFYDVSWRNCYGALRKETGQEKLNFTKECIGIAAILYAKWLLSK